MRTRFLINEHFVLGRRNWLPGRNGFKKTPMRKKIKWLDIFLIYAKLLIE